MRLLIKISRLQNSKQYLNSHFNTTMWRELCKRYGLRYWQWFLGEENVTLSPAISTMHTHSFSYNIYMFFLKEEISKEIKKEKNRKERKELKAGGFNILYLSQGLLAKLRSQVCFLTISQVTESLNQVTEKIRFALNNYQCLPKSLFQFGQYRSSFSA